uniref:RUN domain-containing protein n=1 Tax=Lepeophtheirus salmonis TaxID=72036 RepID=A0A0K2T8D6_LEPSM
MPSFLNRVHGAHRNPDAKDGHKIKGRIKERLSDSIKDIQVKYGENGDKIISNRISGQTLSAIEAIFIHGLKDSILGKISFALGPTSGDRSASIPEPSFWLYLLIFSHRQDIDKVNSFSQISTDIGRCRAWIRVVINAGLLTSYLLSMAKDKASSRSYYHAYAFIRDSECLDIAMRLINGLEIFTFDVATNSSILNKWQSAPLAIAGLIEESKIAVAVDASMMLLGHDVQEKEVGEDEGKKAHSSKKSSEPVNTDNEKSSIRPIENSIMRGLLNEEEALRLILQSSTPISGSPVASTTLNVNVLHPSNLSPPSSLHLKSISSFPSMTDIKSNMSPPTADFMTPPNSFLQNSSLSSVKSDDQAQEISKEDSDCTDEEDSDISSSGECDLEQEEDKASNIVEIKEPSISEKGESTEIENTNNHNHTASENNSKARGSFMSDFTSSYHENMERSKGTRLSGFVDAWDPFGRRNYFDSFPESHESLNYGFSSKPDIHMGGLNQLESQYFMSCFDIVTREQGLDDQNWECFNCNKTVGTVFGPYKTCAYSKKYYCTDCHVDDMRLIPYKVVFNWDFTKYPVSKKAKIFLDAIKLEPIINVQSFNCGLFAYSSDLDALFTLRKKVNYQYQYLKVCTQNPNAYLHLEKVVENRPYLVHDVDTYSLTDLEQTFSGVLISLLKSLDKYARSHILTCLICKGHGFICEICRNDKPLYPFELEKISQCEKCFTVFHKECAGSIVTCPKCERIESRNLNWHVSNVRIKKSSSSNFNAVIETVSSSPSSID